MHQPPLLWLISNAIDIYVFLLIAGAIFSWLQVFGVVNSRNPVVGAIGNFLHRVSDPVLRRVRRYIPVIGGIDISPVIVIMALYFIKYSLNYYWPR